jgi:deoxyribonuclease IV
MPRMLPDGRRLGAHLPLGHGMVKAVDRAHEIGATALQVFADNPTAWQRRSKPPREAPAFRERLAEHGIAPVAIHAAYLVNLAGPEEDFFARSVAVLASDLRAAPTFAARFVNVHIGSHRGAGVTAGIERLADGLALVLAEIDNTDPADPADDGAGARATKPDQPAEHAQPARPDQPGQPAEHAHPARPAMIVLENAAGSGFGLGTDVDELAAIAEAVAARGVAPDRVGYCLDAAHAWAAGIDLSDPAVTDAFLGAFDDRIGLERLVMLHLNDSRSELGSRLDRHEHLGAGRIGIAGLRHLLCHPSLAHVTYILETPGMDDGYDAINVERAFAIAAGRALAELPAGADALTSDRSKTGPPADEPDGDDLVGADLGADRGE